MALAADDHVIVDDNAQQPASLGNPRGDRDIGAAGFGRAGGVIVNHPNRLRNVWIYMI